MVSQRLLMRSQKAWGEGFEELNLIIESNLKMVMTMACVKIVVDFFSLLQMAQIKREISPIMQCFSSVF